MEKRETLMIIERKVKWFTELLIITAYREREWSVLNGKLEMARAEDGGKMMSKR